MAWPRSPPRPLSASRDAGDRALWSAPGVPVRLATVHPPGVFDYQWRWFGLSVISTVCDGSGWVVRVLHWRYS